MTTTRFRRPKATDPTSAEFHVDDMAADDVDTGGSMGGFTPATPAFAEHASDPIFEWDDPDEFDTYSSGDMGSNTEADFHADTMTNPA